MDWKPLEDRDGTIWFDGKMMPWRDAKVHVLTHGLHYGSSVFEGERAYNGKIFKLREHTERLKKSAEILGFDLPYSVAEIDAACEAVCKANNLVDAYIRPVAWRGAEALGVSPAHTNIHLAIGAWAWPSYFSAELREKGIRMIHAPYRRPAPDCAPTQAKAAGLYMICTISKGMAEDAGAQDALMLDYRGQVAEATGANIFLIKDGKLHTPKPDCFLNGITRLTVIELAKARGLEVIERAIMPDELKSFDECFLTGTAAEVTAIGQIGDDLHYQVGPITRQLRGDYEALVKGDADRVEAAAE